MFLYICGDLSKMILPLNICYMHLFFQDMEDDFNRIVDFLINFWVSFQISFLNFINVFCMFLDNLLWRQLN